MLTPASRGTSVDADQVRDHSLDREPPKGKSNTDNTDKAGTPQFLVTVAAPDGWSIAESDSATRFVERVLQERPEVRGVFTNVGRGNPDIYYNVIPGHERPDVAELFVMLDKFVARRTPPMLDSLRARFDAYPNARIQVKEFENGPPIDAPIAL